MTQHEPSTTPKPKSLSSELHAELVELSRLANTEYQAGRLEKAEVACRQLVALDENQASAWHLLGLIILQAGDAVAACPHLERALAIAPENADFQHSLGFALKAAGLLDDAEAAYRRAIALAPDLAETHYNLGNILRETRRFADAEQSYRRVLALKPNHYQACNNLGIVLSELRRIEEGAASFRSAIEIKPDHANAHANLGDVLRSLGHSEEAEAACRRALALAPELSTAQLALGLTLQDLGRFDQALECFRRAGSAVNNDGKAVTCEGMLHLLLGNFTEGWGKYEARWGTPDLPRREPSKPQWNGDEAIAGKQILLHAEQGFGDTIQFLRYVPLVAKRGARVFLEIQQSLRPLVERFVDDIKIVNADEPRSEFDLHCSLLSLPRAFGTTLQTIPAEVPYLRPRSDRVTHWRERLNAHTELKVGIAWAGNPLHKNNRNRSVPPQMLAAFFEVPGFSWFSLQVGENASPALPTVIDLAPELTDFGETAAAIANLDLIITADTAIAHLAGALGKPVWIMLPFSPDWRWLLARDDSPWYPTARLFRQPKPRDWRAVVQQIDAALVEWRDLTGWASRGAMQAETAARKLFEQRQYEEAEELLQKLAFRAPNRPFTWLMLARIRHARGDTDSAIDLLRKTIALESRLPPAHNDLGTFLQQRGRLDEAEASYRHALEIDPRFAEAMNNLGALLAERGRLEEASGWYSRAIYERADFPDAHNNLGAALAKLDRSLEAEALHRRALVLRPDFADAHYNLGVSLQDQGRFDEALASYNEAARLEPDLVDARWNRAYVLLLMGNYTEGWREHEWRWKRKQQPPRSFSRPLWHGEDISGRTILLHAEQGVGDAFQFLRYVPLVAARAGKIIVQVQRPLQRLVAATLGNCVQVCVEGDMLPAFDLHCPLLSLPLAFATTVETIPPPLRYTVGADIAARWRERIDRTGCNVGLVWAGNPQHSNDRNRSIPFERLRPLFDAPRLTWFSLQVGERADHLARPPAGTAIDLSDQLTDFVETAAAIANLDLVIAADTAVAHLAGSLGKPVWVMLPFVPDWRWLLARDDSPWYPTARLFRQPNPRDWPAVIERIRMALTEWRNNG
jgi:tetratricopeptide (TPR) repeat protein